MKQLKDSQGVFTPIKSAATQTGLTLKLFRSGITAGDIPVTVRRIGRRLFVHRDELARWLAPAPAKGVQR
ncbi:hypothetical protein D9M68_969810 [compost metagenome]